MKRIILLSIAVFGLTLCSMATPINQTTAKAIAAKFMEANNLQLATTYRMESNAAALYVFNTPNGFIIVSADDCETPIIGYSNEGRFDPNAVPPQLEDYLQSFIHRIQYGIENHIVADEATAKQWELVKTTGRLNESKSAKAVEPLLTEMWEQGCLYNSLCPEMGKVPCGHAEVGCVAVAMGQIMHYWRYPTTGWGSHSYNNTGIQLSADFGNTTYDWDHMPDSLTEASSQTEIEAVATLLYHCGISVDMSYTTNGSGAESGDVPNALIRYFNYSRRLHIERRTNFDGEEWTSMLKACLDLQQPIYYGGKGSVGNHAFVCDGYDGNDLLHFNWGWGRANGYFALGHLNPISGYSFNEKNFAILDINPQYEPWIIEATPYPPTAGHIEGTGEYHIGEQCVLTAVPAEDCKFFCWKIDGQIVSYDPIYSFEVENDIYGIEANFSDLPATQITGCYAPEADNPNSPCVSLSWEKDDGQFTLVKQFEVSSDCSDGVATDGEHIYTCISQLYCESVAFGKYTLDGDLVELFDFDRSFYTGNLTYDGYHFYCNNIVNMGNNKIFSIDLANKTVLDSINVNKDFSICTYDAVNDGFWLIYADYVNYWGIMIKSMLVDRNGQRIKNGPTLPVSTTGAGYITAKDGNPHLLLLMSNGQVYDYDISNNIIKSQPVASFDELVKGGSIGKYNGKDALIVVNDNIVCIHEIKNTFSQIIGYRLYRSNNEGNTVILADGVHGSTYIDTTWNNADAGQYRFGISSVFSNGVESEIIWSDPIVKTDFGIDENESNQEDAKPSVQKVIEEGHIVIIKDGKRYNVSGQQLN